MMEMRMHQGGNRKPCLFKESDAARAIRAAEKTGHSVERLEVGKDGRIVLVLKERADGEHAA
jgi:hypothetical protein